MSDKPKGRTVPVWVFVVTFVGVAIAAALIGWFVARLLAAPAPIATVPVTATTTVEPTTTVTPTSTVEPTATPTPPTTRKPARVTGVTWSPSKGYQVTVDYVQILTGEDAADAATAAGEESPPPNDYFILNDDPDVLTFSLPKTSSVTVLGWGGTDATAKKKISVGQFMDIMPGGDNPQAEYMDSLFYVTVKAGTTVTKIEQIFFP